MRLLNKLLGLGIIVLFATSCGLDNYKQPDRRISVKILSESDKVPVLTENTRTNMISYNVVQTDEEFPRTSQDYAWHNDEGVVNMYFYDGHYLFFPPVNRGSWVIPQGGNDTLQMTIDGKDMEYEYLVEPYYLFENVSITKNGNTVTATGNIKAYNTSRPIANLYLMVRGSVLLGQTKNDGQRVNQAATPGTFSISMTLNQAMLDKPLLYARVYMQIQGVNDYQHGPIAGPFTK